MHGEENTGREQPAQAISPKVCSERVEVHDTDTSPAKTLTILQGVRTHEQAVSGGAVDTGDRLNQSEDRLTASDYCAEKMRSFGESELNAFGYVNEECVTSFLVERASQVQVTRVSVNIKKVAGVSIISQVIQSSTTVKLVDRAGRVARSRDVTRDRSFLKCLSQVTFGVGESSEGLVGSLQPAKLRWFDLESIGETVALAGV